MSNSLVLCSVKPVISKNVLFKIHLWGVFIWNAVFKLQYLQINVVEVCKLFRPFREKVSQYFEVTRREILSKHTQLFILQNKWVFGTHSKLNLQVIELNWQLTAKAEVWCFKLNIILSISIYWVPTKDDESHCGWDRKWDICSMTFPNFTTLLKG